MHPGPMTSLPSNWAVHFGGPAWDIGTQAAPVLPTNSSRSSRLNWRIRRFRRRAMLAAGALTGRQWSVDVFRFTSSTLLSSRFRNCRRPIHTASSMACPTGPSEEVPSLQFVEHLQTRGGQSVADSGTQSAPCSNTHPEAPHSAGVVAPEDADRRLRLPTVARSRQLAHGAYNSSLMSEEPLFAPRLTGIIEAGEPNQGGVLAGRRKPRRFPPRLLRWHGSSAMERNTSVGASRPQLARFLISLHGSCCIYPEVTNFEVCTRAESPASEHARSLRDSGLIAGVHGSADRVAAPPCPGRI